MQTFVLTQEKVRQHKTSKEEKSWGAFLVSLVLGAFWVLGGVHSFCF